MTLTLEIHQVVFSGICAELARAYDAMQRSELWTGELIDRDDCRRTVTAASVEESEDIIIVEFREIATPPKHVSLSWMGAPILSVIDMDPSGSKLQYNPGSLEWDARHQTLCFIANTAELEVVCASRDAESNKLEPEH